MRKYLFILIPLFLPLALYFLYWFFKKDKKNEDNPEYIKHQWHMIWAFGAGVVLLALSLLLYSYQGQDQHSSGYHTPSYQGPTAPPLPEKAPAEKTIED